MPRFLITATVEAAAVLIAAGGKVAAADALQSAELRTYSTWHSIGVEWDVLGDANHNAKCDVQYRTAGAERWRKALPLFRIDYHGWYGDTKADRAYNMLAGSILFLEPGTAYEVQLVATDPDGGLESRTVVVGTRPIPALPRGGRTWHAWHYASSTSFSKKLWKDVGAYLTLGWPQDTTGLEDGCISDEQFLELCQTFFSRRIQILYYLMNDFKEGVLAGIFDDLDRVQHMFFHNRMDVVEDWYKRLDAFVGDVRGKVDAWSGKYRFLIMSDHGFSDFRNKVHVNRWLLGKWLSGHEEWRFRSERRRLGQDQGIRVRAEQHLPQRCRTGRAGDRFGR